MEDNIEFNEDTIRVQGLYRKCQLLRHSQKLQIRELMDMHKQQILTICSQAKIFQSKLKSLLPNDNQKLMKKIAKHEWVKIFADHSKLQYQIHEDYCTYIIYNSISVPNGKQDTQDIYLQDNIFQDYEEEVCKYIEQINQGFNENLKQQEINSHQFEQLDNSEYYEIIEYISYQIDDIITEEQEYQIEYFMRQAVLKKLSKEILDVAEFFNKSYSNLISKIEIEPSQYPDQFCYGNFGKCFNGAKPKENKQQKIQEIQECQDLSKLEVGIYSIKVKKTIIILEITAKQKIAFIINYFDHYRKTSSIFEKLSDFLIWKIRTIKLSVEQAYALIKYLKKKNRSHKQFQNETIEFYKKQDFDEFNRLLELEEKNYKNTFEDIKRCVSAIIPQSNNYKDIYSQVVVQQLQQKQNLDLIPIIEFDYDLNKLKNLQIQKAAILEDKQKLTIGVVIYPNQNQTILLSKNINNMAKDNDCSLESTKNMNQNEKILFYYPNTYGEDYTDFYLKIKKLKLDEKCTIICDVNTKEIQSTVAQFYVTLILQRSENIVYKNIKSFLELKIDAWSTILGYLG